MNHIIENLTRRPVTIMGNSGKSYHLPPRFKLALNALEVTENAFVQKLEARNIVAVRDLNKAVKDATKSKIDADKSEGKSESTGKGKRQ